MDWSLFSKWIRYFEIDCEVQGLIQALEILGILFFKGEHNVLRLQP